MKVITVSGDHVASVLLQHHATGSPIAQLVEMLNSYGGNLTNEEKRHELRAGKEQSGKEMLINMDHVKTIRKSQSGCIVNFIDHAQQDVKLECDLDVVMKHVPIRARLLVAGEAQ